MRQRPPAGTLRRMNPQRRAQRIAVSVLAAGALAWTAAGSPATPEPERPVGEVPEVDTALFAVG